MTNSEKVPYSWVGMVTAPVPHEADHVDIIEIGRLMLGAWMNYLAFTMDKALDAQSNGWRPIVRRVNITFESAVAPGERLVCGVRALNRTRRTFTLEQEAAHGDDRRRGVAASGELVLTTIDTKTGRSIEIPGPFWHEVEQFERRSISVDTRS